MSLENFEVDALIFRKATQEDLPKIMAFVDIFLRKDWLVRRTYLNLFIYVLTHLKELGGFFIFSRLSFSHFGGR